MAFDDSDRRRVFLAFLVTVVALGAFWWANRADDSSDAGGSAAPATLGPGEGGIINPGPAATEEPTSAAPGTTDIDFPESDPIFMDGPAPDPNGGVAEVAVPAQPATDPIRMSATYRGTIAGVRSCIVRGITTGQTVTVTNLDNGRSVTCVTTFAPAEQQEDIVLHTRNFEQLADLTEAPIPVEVSQ